MANMPLIPPPEPDRGMLDTIQAQSDKLDEGKKLTETFGPIIKGRQEALEPLYEQAAQKFREPLPQVPHQQRVPSPPPQDLGKDAMMWIAAATALGGMAGALTRRGSINALTAFSGALNGYKAGDKERFEANYKTWDAEARQIEDNNEAQWREYEAIVKRRDLDQRQMSNLIQITATKWENQYMAQVAQHAAQTGNFEMLAAAFDGAKGQIGQMAAAREKMANAVEVARIRSGAENRQSEEAIDERVELALAGNPMATRGMSVRSPDWARFSNRFAQIAKQRGLSPDEINRRMTQYAGDISEARTAGTIGARVEYATGELSTTVPLALKASEQLPRGNFRSWNAFQQAAQREFSSPQFETFDVMHNAVISAYARAMAPLGVGNVDAVNRAKGVLEKSTGPDAYRAGMVALMQEVQASRKAAAQLRGKPEPAPVTLPPATPQTKPQGGQGTTSGNAGGIPWKRIDEPGPQSSIEEDTAASPFVMSDASPEPVTPGQRYAMADEPPPPTGGRKPLADPVRPRPLVATSGMPQRAAYGTSAVNQYGPTFANQPERVQRFMELLGKGKTLEEAAEELGVGTRTLRRYSTDELGVRQRSVNVRDDPEQLGRYKDMVEKGFSQRQMAEKLNLNVGTVSKQLAALRAAGYLKDYTPGGGKRVPSMPRFKFADDDVEIDEGYIKALETYLDALKKAKGGG